MTKGERERARRQGDRESVKRVREGVRIFFFFFSRPSGVNTSYKDKQITKRANTLITAIAQSSRGQIRLSIGKKTKKEKKEKKRKSRPLRC